MLASQRSAKSGHAVWLAVSLLSVLLQRISVQAAVLDPDMQLCGRDTPCVAGIDSETELVMLQTDIRIGALTSGHTASSANRPSQRSSTEWSAPLLVLLTLAVGGATVLFLVILAVNVLVDHGNPHEAAEDSSILDDPDGCTIAQTSCNIAKSAVSKGILTLSAVMEMGTGILPALACVLGVTLVMWQTFNMLGRVSHYTGGTTQKDCALKLSAPVQAHAMAMTLAVDSYLTCTGYAMIIADSGSHLLTALGANSIFSSRIFALLAATVTMLLPLCLQKLKVLSYTSFVGLCSVVLVVMFMELRYIDGSYREGGRYYEQLAPQDRPTFAAENGLRLSYFGLSWHSVMLAGTTLSSCFAHANSTQFYLDLRRRSSLRFVAASSMAYIFVGLMTAWAMVLGALTFGTRAQGLILNNYSDGDPLAGIARTAISVAGICAFPLVFGALRENGCSALGLPAEAARISSGACRFFGITLAFLVPVIALAGALRNLAALAGLVGCLSSNLLALGFPGRLCYLSYRRQQQQQQQEEDEEKGKAEFVKIDLYMSIAAMVLGLPLIAIGAPLSIASLLNGS